MMRLWGMWTVEGNRVGFVGEIPFDPVVSP